MHPLAAYLHTFDGTIFTISGEFAVRLYGLTYVLGFVFAWLTLWRLARRGRIEIPAHRVPDAMLIIVACTLLGGRIGYALVYDQNLLAPSQFIRVWQGGMASHGGMVGIIIGCWIISRGFRPMDSGSSATISSSVPAPAPVAASGVSKVEREGKTSMLHVMDCFALVAPFGLFFGRIANFVNGELLGKIVTPPGAPGPAWTVQFPQELFGQLPGGGIERGHHAVQLTTEQADALDALVRSAMISVDPFGNITNPMERWEKSLGYVVKHAEQYREQLTPLLSSRHASQLYQAAAEGLLLGVCVWVIWRISRTPGVTAAWWLIIYGVLRVVTEIWRLPDAQFGDAGRIAGLSRGQWLSVGMVAVGGVLLGFILARRKPVGTPSP